MSKQFHIFLSDMLWFSFNDGWVGVVCVCDSAIECKSKKKKGVGFGSPLFSHSTIFDPGGTANS